MQTRLCDNMLLVLVLILVQMFGVHSQDPQWPLHTVCDSERITVTYRSCDPLQDVGFTFLPCPERLTDLIKIRLALILRQSIDELYSSYELWLNGHSILKRDEPLCLPHFPRFKFCGSRRGEIITVESSFKSKMNLPLKADFDLKLRAINQDGFQIACVNATLSFH
ncbi:lymphocyte antigen 86 [Cyprinus carpio]|uniref:Lymphocyte antigen 86 n=1 Tax=Cyprinus carpio TaxID=7962 RepID=A0A8C1H0K4_CYPCA|nr:lymphocyte antigen 86 [Cyprinus carpio]